MLVDDVGVQPARHDKSAAQLIQSASTNATRDARFIVVWAWARLANRPVPIVAACP
jgi:hypothetical protein